MSSVHFEFGNEKAPAGGVPMGSTDRRTKETLAVYGRVSGLLSYELSLPLGQSGVNHALAPPASREEGRYELLVS